MMAGDWIKVEHALSEKPEVIATATRLNVDPDLIVGKLFRMWRWFDNHTVDGTAPGVTPAFIDRHVELEGFAAALTAVNWLSHRNGSLAVPNFDRHCSKSAKERGLASARMKRSRCAPSATEPQPDNILSLSFSLFWKAFPAGRKKSKRRAREAFDRACKRADSSVIIAAAKDYAASDEGRGQYVKMPETWLNGDCWEDDRAAWKNRDGQKPPPPDRSRLEAKRQANGALYYT